MARRIIGERILLNGHLHKGEKPVSGLQNICGEKECVTLEGVPCPTKQYSCRDERMRVILLVIYRSLRIDRHRKKLLHGGKPKGCSNKGGCRGRTGPLTIFWTIWEILSRVKFKMYQLGDPSLGVEAKEEVKITFQRKKKFRHGMHREGKMKVQKRRGIPPQKRTVCAL